MKKILILLCIVFTFMSVSNVAAEQGAANADDGYAAIGEAIMHAKQKDWSGIEDSAAQFSVFAEQIKPTDKYEKEVTSIKEKANMLEEQVEKRNDWSKIQNTLQEASHAVRAYDEALHPVDKNKERAKLGVLLPITDRLDKALDENDLNRAKAAYDQLNKTWTANEAIVRTDSVASYGAIETNLSMMRIGFEQKPVNMAQIKTGNDGFIEAVKGFMEGKKEEKSKEKSSLNDVVKLLEQSQTSIKDEKAVNAVKPLQEIIRIWPTVEGEVRIKDPSLYNDVENKIPAAIGKLQSEKPDYNKASVIISDLHDRLKILSSNTSYNFVDAMLILLREGIEAILIVAGLIAFLKRANNGEGKRWIWGGAGAGIIASLALAVVMVIFFANAGGAQNRETLEGTIGLAAVIMMLSIGAWLHKRSNILNWNAYFERNMGKAIATGSLLSMASLSFLAIFREGAETVIFYIGMAPAIELKELLIGIGTALVILALLALVIIRFSSRIPLRPFFAIAAWLIYILAFKMVGASVHALQVAGIFSVHVADYVPFINWLGIYPTLETILPQLLLIGLILFTSIHLKRAANAAKT
ncbi:FTR1 family protein [Aciduricibacillus chroicocephali]|uniref:FTR1 family protein n=1 Tax=Aciduricibacillus chroicocephali TaxID=3054939 RepID=A0ABY9KXM1_9BACI|nr:FTR1 family protein [Bacillaceae bacterium 44XB]